MTRKIIFAVLTVFMAVSAYSQSKFYVEDIVIPPNEQANLVIKYEFDAENSYTSYSFDLTLPEGVSIVKNARGKYIYQLGDCHEDTHSLTINYVEDENLYGIACLSLESDPLFGKSGVLITIPIQADNSNKGQETRQGKIQEIKLVPLDGSTSQRLEESAFNVTYGTPIADAVTLTANNITREYGEKNPDFSYTVTNGSIKGGTPKITCEANEFSPAGKYTIKIEKGSVTNKDVTLVDGTLTITKAPLTAKAKSYTRYQGEANPVFEIEYSGFKNGENDNALTKKPTATTTATTASGPGTYPITPSGGVSGNYNFEYVNGTLTVIEQQKILVNKITLSQTSATMNVGDNLQLSATVSPTNATDKSVTWTTSNQNVATVSSTGKVTAVAAGNATITCSANDGSGMKATCSLTVIDPAPGPVGNVALSIEQFKIKAGEEKEISIDLSNPDDEITMVQFDLSLPKGLSLKMQGGDYVYDKTDRATSRHTLDAEAMGDIVRFILLSNRNNALNGSSGAIIKMTLVADASFNGGEIVLSNIVLARPDETQIKLDAYTYHVTTDLPDSGINEGYYYIRNVASGLFITCGGNWGTHIAVDKRGLDLYLRKSLDGKHWVINSGFIYSQTTEGALGTEGYVDNGVGIDHELTQISENIFTIKADNGFLLTTNDKNNLADFEGESASDKRAQWEFVKADELYAQRMAALFNASSTNPVDATFLIPNANINNARDQRIAAWNRNAGNANNNYGISDIDTEPIMEFFRNGDIMCSNPFSFSQAISLIPGYYKLEAQGFYRDGGYSDATTRRTNGEEQIDAYLFAGDKQIPLKSIFDDATPEREKGFSIKTTHGYIPNTMTEAGYTFQSGAYNNELFFNVPEVPDKVDIGIRGDESFHYNNWTAFDNFQLTYYGEENPNQPSLFAEDVAIGDVTWGRNTGELRIYLDNPGMTVSGVTFSVHLPNDVNVESVTPGDRCEGDKWQTDFYKNDSFGTFHAIVYNTGGQSFKGESGQICVLKLKANNSAKEGEFTCVINEIEMSTKDDNGYKTVYPSDTAFKFTIVNDIETITQGENVSQPVYTLQGVRTTSPKRGVYIRNGKKVVVK